MQVVILAGGMGTRLLEETSRIPKPMVEISDKPILWHVMRIFSDQGHNNFVIACGYKGNVIKQYFKDYYYLENDFTIQLKSGEITPINEFTPNWTVSLVNTGLKTMTGGRLKRLTNCLNESFLVTYGDGLSNVDLKALIKFHRSHGKLATVTAVQPSARFGSLIIKNSRVLEFAEKIPSGEGWINGGFFVFEKGILDYIADDSVSLEQTPLEKLASDGQLMAFEHTGFWHPMDTLRDKNYLQKRIEEGDAPWLQNENTGSF